MSYSSSLPIVPMILSGGAGTRLWPLSRKNYPKQLLPLYGKETLLQQTALRVHKNHLFTAPMVIANEEHRFVVAHQLQDVGVTPSHLVLEKEGRNTAPAIAALAWMVERHWPGHLMLVMPSDHVITDVEKWYEIMTKASKAASENYLVTLGIVPGYPATGYGYIQVAQGQETKGGYYDVKAFIEKPVELKAKAFLEEGGYYWNSGMFVMKPSVYLTHLRELEPELYHYAHKAVVEGKEEPDFFRLGGSFLQCKNISIDCAVMERAKDVALVPMEVGWNDIGAWKALWDISEKDEQQNVLYGKKEHIFTHDTKGSYLQTEGILVATVGIEDMVVVATEDAVMVSRKDTVQDIKVIVDMLKVKARQEYDTPREVHRPWGKYKTLQKEERMLVKQLVIYPGKRISLQYHHHRSESWVVVKGQAKVTRGNEEFILLENQSTFIPAEMVHRLENIGKEELHIIEVQSGIYIGEDDITRIEDDFRREHVA